MYVKAENQFGKWEVWVDRKQIGWLVYDNEIWSAYSHLGNFITHGESKDTAAKALRQWWQDQRQQWCDVQNQYKYRRISKLL